MQLDQVIAELGEAAGASRLSQDRLALARAVKADLGELRAELLVEIKKAAGEVVVRGVDMRPLSEVEEEHIVRVYAALHDVAAAAQCLAVSPAHVYRVLKRRNVATPKKEKSCARSSSSLSSPSPPERRSELVSASR